ncbi:MAG: helix-turn-helix transcriptional regulator [Polyangiales bacterium]
MLTRTPTGIGLVVRERRRELGLGQAELAERVGVSRQWVVEIEQGKPRAELALVLRTLQALGLRLRIDHGTNAPATSIPSAPDIDAIVRAHRGPRG